MRPEAQPSPAYHHGDLKAALVAAVLRLVREKGPRGFTLNEASRAAGVSVAAPYRHFRDKDALLAEVVRRGNDLLATELRAAAGGGGTIEDRIVAVGLAYAEFASDHPDYFATMFGSGLDKSRYPEVAASAAEAFGVLRELTAAAVASPETARDLALATWALAHGWATLGAEGALTLATGKPLDAEAFGAMLRDQTLSARRRAPG